MIFSNYTYILQSLGIALLSSLWQAAVVWLCYSVINSQIKLSSSKKYFLSIISELIIFIWFLISFITNLFSFENLQSVKVSPQILSLNKEWINPSVLPIISFIYLMVLIGMITKWIIDFYNTQKIYRNNLISLENKWQQWINQKSSQLNIKKSIKIFLTTNVQVPLTVGFFRPFILLPIAITNHLTVTELETILLHELSHIKRSDYLINILLSIVETILYFNPVIIYFKKMIRRERENICDDEVLLQQYSAIEYAESLLKLAKFSLNKPELAFAMSASNNHQQLLQRIQRITKTNKQQKQKLSSYISFALILTFFTVLTLLYIPHYNQSLKNKNIATVNSNYTATISLTTKENITAKGISSAISSIPSKKIKQKNIISDKKKDDKLNIALESLKRITIPQIQNNIEEYRKNLSGNEAQLLADENLKQKIKDYISLKNISINDFINKIDSVKHNENNALENYKTNKNIIIPASYIEKDSLNNYIQQNNIKTKHVIIIPNNIEAPYYLVIHSHNENNEPIYIFIPYKPEQTID